MFPVAIGDLGTQTNVFHTLLDSFFSTPEHLIVDISLPTHAYLVSLPMAGMRFTYR